MSPNMTISRARPNLLSDKVYMNHNVYRECEQSYGQTPAFFKDDGDWSQLASHTELALCIPIFNRLVKLVTSCISNMNL